MTASERLLQRVLVTSKLDAGEWNKVQLDLRERAFFSSKVESARLLQAARTRIARDLEQERTGDGGTYATRTQTVTAIAEKARELGLSSGKGGVTDLGSVRRAALIADTNAAFAAGAIRRKADLSVGARAAFPAQELVRIRRAKDPRDWTSRWRAAGGRLYDGGRMIALVEDPIWSRISAFGLPYPPFDWGSGMGLESVDFDEAVSLGVITEDYMPQPVDDPRCEINHKLAVSTQGLEKSSIDFLKDAFGDQISIRGDEMNWQPDIIRRRLRGKGEAKVNLGKAQKSLLDKLPPEIDRHDVEGRSLSVTSNWLLTHGSKHFGKDADEKNHGKFPLTEADYDLIPTIWRDPDRVTPYDPKHKIVTLWFDTFDGGTLKLGVCLTGGPHPTTFHKKRKGKENALK